VDCSFCLRDRSEVGRLVHGTGAAICVDCVLRIAEALESSTLETRLECTQQLSLLASRNDEAVNGFGSERACRVALVVAAFAQYFDHWLQSECVAEQLRATSHFWQLLRTGYAWNEEGHFDVAAALTALADHGSGLHGGA